MSLFKGRVAFVTGAGGGIGRAICKILARDGARVLVSDIDEKNAQDTTNSLPNPENHLAIHLNVCEATSIEKALNACQSQFGKSPTLLAQSAGITRDNFLHKLELKQFQDVIDINLMGTFLVQQSFVRRVVEAQETGGSFVNISSVVAKHGNMGQSNYAASKAGVEAFSKSTAKELGKKGIRVNCVVPGFIETPMVESVPDHLKSMLLMVTPLQRMGRPDEIAEVVSFLLSEKSSFMTGALVEVTGGLSM